MWPFLTKVITKKRQRAAFGQFLSEETFRDIQETSNLRSGQLPPPEQEEICYIALQVRGNTPEEIQHHLARAIDVVIDHGGMVEQIMSGIVTATFKPTLDSSKPSTHAASGELGPNVRAVYGRGTYLRGAIGSGERFTHGTIFPHMQRMLETLFALEFGASKEI
jgi:hypothetical protein